MSQKYTFTPQYGKGITVTPTGTSASSTLGKNLKQLVVTNTGTVNCYVAPRDTATAADYIVLPNTQVAITKPQDIDVVSYITASGTGALHIIAGEGF